MAHESPTRTNPASANPADSPWFWAAVFVVGALLALVLARPKFQGRQEQIERQFQARERAGQTLPPSGGVVPRREGQTFLTLQPLLLFFSAALAGLTAWYWYQRWATQSKDQRAGPQ